MKIQLPLYSYNEVLTYFNLSYYEFNQSMGAMWPVLTQEA